MNDFCPTETLTTNCLTKYYTELELQNPSIDEFYAALKLYGLKKFSLLAKLVSHAFDSSLVVNWFAVAAFPGIFFPQ